jgi:hypothetical protein
VPFEKLLKVVVNSVLQRLFVSFAAIFRSRSLMTEPDFKCQAGVCVEMGSTAGGAGDSTFCVDCTVVVEMLPGGTGTPSSNRKYVYNALRRPVAVFEINRITTC